VKLDHDQIGRLYRQHGRGLIAYACSFVRGFEAAEDVVHQVFVRLLHGHVTIEGPPAPYLYRAVRNSALNDCRNHSRDVELNEAWLEGPPGMEGTTLVIESALRALPPEQHEVITLRIWGQMTFEEIAVTIGIPQKTAESRYRYGLVKLREEFRPVTKG
jgi:RNA polymerase sigma-70 factor (ECF subfamily)